MLLTVFTLGSTLLGAATIAGLLIVYEIRQSTDLANSGKAIFAADAGTEWALYNLTCGSSGGAKLPCPVVSPVNLTNDTSVDVKCFDTSGAEVSCSDQSVQEIRSIGTSKTSSRALRVNF